MSVKPSDQRHPSASVRPVPASQNQIKPNFLDVVINQSSVPRILTKAIHIQHSTNEVDVQKTKKNQLRFGMQRQHMGNIEISLYHLSFSRWSKLNKQVVFTTFAMFRHQLGIWPIFDRVQDRTVLIAVRNEIAVLLIENVLFRCETNLHAFWVYERSAKLRMTI